MPRPASSRSPIPTKIDFETAPGHAYTETVQASDGTLTSSQTFTIGVTDVPPSTPVDSDASRQLRSSKAPPQVRRSASLRRSTDVNGPAVTYSLTGDTSGGGYHHQCRDRRRHRRRSRPRSISRVRGAGHSYMIIVQASDGTDDEFADLHHRRRPMRRHRSPSTAMRPPTPSWKVRPAGTTVGVTAHRPTSTGRP